MKPSALFFLSLWIWLPGPLGHAITVGTDPEILAKLRGQLASQPGDYLNRTITRKGNKTIEMEAVACTEADFNEAVAILSNYGDYQRWALTNINKKPQGGTYLMQVLKLTYEPVKSTIVTDVLFDLPLFQKELRFLLNVKYSRQGDVFTVFGNIDDTPGEASYIDSVEIVFKMFPAEKKVHHAWLYLKGVVKIRNWLLYEAMPEKLLQRETGERFQILLDNYVHEEDRFRLAQESAVKTAPRSSQSPKGKKAMSDKQPASARPR